MAKKPKLNDKAAKIIALIVIALAIWKMWDIFAAVVLFIYE
jgi:hypothetical protein